MRWRSWVNTIALFCFLCASARASVTHYVVGLDPVETYACYSGGELLGTVQSDSAGTVRCWATVASPFALVATGRTSDVPDGGAVASPVTIRPQPPATPDVSEHVDDRLTMPQPKPRSRGCGAGAHLPLIGAAIWAGRRRATRPKR